MWPPLPFLCSIVLLVLMSRIFRFFLPEMGRVAGRIFGSLLILVIVTTQAMADSFDDNYIITWGGYHVRSYDSRRVVQLVMDRNSGSGFQSKSKYLYGNFTTRIKLVHGDSSGIVTAFYLTSQENSHHDEVDFEFLGATSGNLYRVQTNVFVDGGGNREEKIRLWFDPTTDFHTYSIIWDALQILFMVDGQVIRIFKNLNKALKVPFPLSKPMFVVASIWNGEDWATDGGKRKIRWSNAPFHVSFQGFDIQGGKCGSIIPTNQSSSSSSSSCLPSNSSSPWSYAPPKPLVADQQRSLQRIRNTYLTYTYCRDKARYPKTPPECRDNEFYP